VEQRRIEEVRALLREAVNDALSAYVVIAAEPLQDVLYVSEISI
jgi:hypothetical protein